jgi:hypothetical protein
VIYTHILNERIAQLAERAERDLAATHDVHVIGFFPDDVPAPRGFGTRPRHQVFRKADLLRHDYPGEGAPDAVPPSPRQQRPAAPGLRRAPPPVPDLLVLRGRRGVHRPAVAARGAFRRLNADLLTTNVRPFQARWPHERLIVLPPGWSRDAAHELLSFLPVYRVSRRLLERIDAFYRAGGSGHNEWSWTYVAQWHGLGIEDIGGTGPYVAAGNRRRFYTSTPRTPSLAPGTFRYRPMMRLPGRRPMMLWHPVKDAPIPPRKQLREALTMMRELIGRG